MSRFVGAVDQGTTSTRFIVFDRDGVEQGSHQLEHQQIMPQPGWVEHNALEIWERTAAVITTTLSRMHIGAADLAAIGITNQRETTLVWNRRTGRPYGNAIVWQDTRTASMAGSLEGEYGEMIRAKTGLLPSPYFSSSKCKWILDNVEGAREAADAGDAVFGTMDTWLLWNLTGGRQGGVHITDVTNASRTMLMDLKTLDWDDELLELFSIPRSMLPKIRPSSDPNLYGSTTEDGPFAGRIAIGGAVGDQHGALIGQAALNKGETKNTYGTGNFLMMNTGEEPTVSNNGLLTTLAYQFGDAPARYALEGSVAVSGSAVQWLRDQLGIISGASQSESLASQVPDSGGMYFVPAFSGLFAPYWRPDARGVIVGMSRFNTNAHLARATLEAICFQSRDVLDAMAQDSGVSFEELRVDGGISRNSLCMQIQANVLGIPIRRPKVTETTALGAAYAAGLAVGYWASPDELKANWHEDRSWEPEWSDDERKERYAGWKKAVSRTLDWVEVDQ